LKLYLISSPFNIFYYSNLVPILFIVISFIWDIFYLIFFFTISSSLSFFSISSSLSFFSYKIWSSFFWLLFFFNFVWFFFSILSFNIKLVKNWAFWLSSNLEFYKLRVLEINLSLQGHSGLLYFFSQLCLVFSPYF
jgi:hypothetical protein